MYHEGFEKLLDIVESSPADGDDFSHAVYGIHNLAGHLGVVAPELTLEPKDEGKCYFEDALNGLGDEDRVVLVLDDETEVVANRAKVTEASEVFGVMLSGGFAEAEQTRVRIRQTGRQALELLLHYLYGCRWCPSFAGLPAETLLELASMTDKYILPEFNRTVSHEIVQRCLRVDQAAAVYERALQGQFPVHGLEDNLAVCAVNYILVGQMDHATRTGVVAKILASKMKSDFADDIAKTIRKKLLEM